MINIVHTEHDHLLVSLYLIKQDDTGVPNIECTINQWTFQKTFCDTGAGVNIMAKVTYNLIFGDKPLHPTYVQLQMADQTFWISEGIAKDIMVKIRDHYTPTDFMALNMGEEEHDPPIVLEVHSSIRLEKSTWERERSTSNFPMRMYVVTSTVIQHMTSQRRTDQEGGVVHPNAKRINS